MRRSVGSVRRLATGVWRVEVEHGRDPVTGKRRRYSRTVHGSKREAESTLSRMLLDAGSRPDSSMILADYIENVWLPAVRDKVRERTAVEYQSKCDIHIIPKLGQMKLSDLEPYTLDRWMADLQTKVSPRTAHHAYRVLCSALNRAVKWRLIAANPLHAVDAPSVERKQQDVLTLEEARAYLEAFRGHKLEPVVVLGIAAGLRRSEIAALTWRDIDLDARTVSVTKGMHERGGRVWNEPPKSKTSRRVVSLPEWAVESLRHHRALGPLVSEDGCAMRPNRISALYVRHVEQSGLRRVPLKQLRHTSATIALAAGVDLVSVSRRLGHSSVAVTDAHYIAHTRSADQKAADAMSCLEPPKHRRIRKAK